MMATEKTLTTVEKLKELTLLKPEIFANAALHHKQADFLTGHRELFKLVASKISVLQTNLPANAHARKDSAIGQEIETFCVSRTGHFLSNSQPLSVQFNIENDEVVRISKHSSYDGGPPLFYDVRKMADEIAATRALVDNAHAINTVSHLAV